MKGTMYTDVKTIHDIGKTLAEMQRTLKGASILARRGTVEVDASVEPYAEQQERFARERAEAEEEHARMARLLQPPDAAPGNPASPARFGYHDATTPSAQDSRRRKGARPGRSPLRVPLAGSAAVRLDPAQQAVERERGETWVKLKHDSGTWMEAQFLLSDGWVNFYGVMGHDEAYSVHPEPRDGWESDTIDILADLLQSGFTVNTYTLQGQP